MKRSLISVLAISLALPVASASAQEEGVTVDRDSSSAKEYALPLETARREGTDGRAKRDVEQGVRRSPAFGEGVAVPENDDDPKANDRGRSRDGGAREGTAGPPIRDVQDADAGSKRAAGRESLAQPQEKVLGAARPTAAKSEDLDDTTVALLGGGGAVLLAGFGGIALRRLRNST